MENKQNEAIQNIQNINIHYQNEQETSILSIIQLDSGLILLGLSNGVVNFYLQTNLREVNSTLTVDNAPIYSMVQLPDDLIICSTGGPNLCVLQESPLRPKRYDVKEKIKANRLAGQINKIINLSNDILISGDNIYISLWVKKSGFKFNLIKSLKIGSPIVDLLIVGSNIVACAVPKKQNVIFIDSDKLTQTYIINNLKFVNDLIFSNILVKLQKDLLIIGGTKGIIYLVNLKNKNLVANIKLRFPEEIISSMARMSNGNLLCGTSIILEEKNSKGKKIVSDLVQYIYEPKCFHEIHRKENVHSNIIINAIEVSNHRGIKEIGTISLDNTFKIWS